MTPTPPHISDMHSTSAAGVWIVTNGDIRGCLAFSLRGMPLSRKEEGPASLLLAGATEGSLFALSIPSPPARDNPSFFGILPCILDLSRLALVDADTPRSCFCTFVACERPRRGTAGVSVVMGLDLML